MSTVNTILNKTGPIDISRLPDPIESEFTPETFSKILIKGILAGDEIDDITEKAFKKLPRKLRTDDNLLEIDGLVRRSIQNLLPHVDQKPAGAFLELNPSLKNSGDVTAEQLVAIMPGCPKDNLDLYLPFLNQAIREGNINTPQRRAAFLAQVAVESDELNSFEEYGNEAYFQKYEPGTRKGKGLGNILPGDGKRYKGRGPCQLTGRWNYEACGKALGLNLIEHPELVATPTIGFKTAIWYWNFRGLNSLADSGQFGLISKRVNGGANGKNRREIFYQRALNILQKL